MALNIKDPETDRLARELADATGESITVAARTALAERLARVRAKALVTEGADDLQMIITRGRGRPMLEDRTPDELLGYDGHGLPA